MSATGPAGRRRRRRRASTTTATTDVAGAVLLAFSIVGSALAIGAQHTSVLVVVAVLAAAAALALGPHHASRTPWLLLGLAAYTLLQLVPLPLGWLAWLSPDAAAIWREALSPFRAPPPAWGSLSVDPAATTLEGVKWSGYGCVLLAAQAWRARRGNAGLAWLLFGSALAVALVTLAHGVFDAPRIYGMFIPVHESRWTRGPFVNPNPLAGYLNIGLFAGLGLWQARRDGRFERFIPVGVLMLAILVVLTGSRGGVATLVLGILMFTALVLRRNRFDRGRLAFAFGGLVVGAFVMATAIRGSTLWTELADTDVEGKIRPWPWALQMISDFPVFGVGRGAFETAFQTYRKASGDDWTTVYAHAENFPIEWVSDWGIPVGLVAIFGCLLLARQVLRGVLREPIAAGVGVGLAALFLQNVMDLALETFAVSAAAWVAYAASREDSKDGVNASRRWLALAPVIGVVVGVLVALSTGATPVQVEREEIARSYKAFFASKSRDVRAMRAELRSAMLSHPAEAYFPLIGALVARLNPGDDPLRWLNRSLERAPMNGTTHLALAEVLADRGALGQALLHVRLTALYDRTLREYAYGRTVTWARTTAELVSVFPRGLPGSELLEGLCAMAQGEPRIGCFREAVARHPTSHALHRLVSSLLESVEAGTVPCDGPRGAACTDEVERFSRKLGATDWRTTDYRARIQARRGDFKGAAQTGLEGCPANSEAVACLKRSFDFSLRGRDLVLAARTADRYAAVRCGEASECAEAHDRIGVGYAELGAWRQALEHYSAAAGAEPTTDRWIRNADAAARAGSSAKARSFVDRALQEGNLNAEQRERLAAVDQLLRASR